jgi:hypothetical protein
MDGKPNCFALVCKGTTDGLFNPPAGVGTKFHATTGFEAVDRFHEAEVAFGNEVKDG